MTTTKHSLRRAVRAIRMVDERGPEAVGTRRTIVIERISPELDAGRHPVKRAVGDLLLVTADIFADGHDVLDAALLLRADDEHEWREAPMRHITNDRWSGTVELTRNRWHRYAIEAWRDAFGSWRHGVERKVTADVPVTTEIEDGRLLLDDALLRADAAEAGSDAQLIRAALTALSASRTEATAVKVLSADELLATMRRHPDRSLATRSAELPLVVDRERGRFGAWYELFPRSQGRDPSNPVPTTFVEAEWRLPEIAAMGFDVVYVPPIHPIGRTNRKGRNNTLAATADDVGSPYAIGSVEGGHDAVAPELGGVDAFVHFREAVESHGMEVALDIALQAAPDHPYVQSNPEWFRRNPDGSIKYAENPPKKYQDIYAIYFYSPDASVREALWREWRRVFAVWIDRGVKIFRVDNPHTKPVPFWTWLIADLQREHPDVVFLSEAFTRPKMMQELAKVGFTQSYTYFTWRETAPELRAYLTELTQSEMREYFRGNLFANTPDINPHHLDHGRAAFVARTVLAATLSSLYGIYSGWELCENARLEDREEYVDSEKYEIRARDWDAPGNIKPLISQLNRLRHELPALRGYDNLRFEQVTGERTLFYRKAMPHGPLDPLTGQPGQWRDPVYVAVNCDPMKSERAVLHPDLPAVGIGWDEPYTLTDLLTGQSSRELGADLSVELDPAADSFRIFTIAPLAR